MAYTYLKLKAENIDNEGYHMVVKVKINGKSARLLLDTGASRTVFDEKSIKKIVSDEPLSPNHLPSVGLGTNNMQSHHIVLDTLEFGKIEFKSLSALVLDLNNVNVSYASMNIKPIVGVLGSDILMMTEAVIDYGKKRIRMNRV